MNGHLTNAMTTLKRLLNTMSAAALEALILSGKAVAEGSESCVARVIAGDEALDSMEIQLEEECLKTLALHQPVASDLRRVITILKVNNELERIGDLGVNMAERVSDLASFRNCGIEQMDFDGILRLACDILKQAMDSLTYHDEALARAVIARDEAVDRIHHDNYAIVRSFILKYPDCAQYYLNGLTISRCLERVADSATNIAEDVIYLESGKIVRHLPAGKGR